MDQWDEAVSIFFIRSPKSIDHPRKNPIVISLIEPE